MRPGVAVTGIGIVSPIGIGGEQFWRMLCAGQSGIAPLERTPPSARLPTIAAQVRGFIAKDFIHSHHLRRMDKFARMVVAAGRMALDDARLAPDRVSPERFGIVVGSALGDISESVGLLEKVFTKGPASASPMIFPNLVLNAAASDASMVLGITGVNLTVAQAETSGEQAILLGCDLLRTGRAEVVLAGGGDELASIVSDVFHRARILSGQRGGSEWSSPYDTARNGVVLGEGAAMLALEPSAQARARGARVYAEIEADTSFSVPAPSYDWPAQAAAVLPTLRRMLADRPVDLICGSANSSRGLDACELELFHHLSGDRAGAVSLTSIKGAIGEFGAAGALSVAAGCLALHEQTVPPLCHLHTPEPGARFRFAAGRGETRRIERVLVCGLARGGAGAALLLRRQVP